MRGASEGGVEESGGAGRDETGTAREAGTEGERTGGERDAEADDDEDEARELRGNKDEASALGTRQRRAQSMMIPAKNGMFMSSALVEGRNTEGGGALENGKAAMISGLRSSSSPMRCNCADRDSSAPANDGSKSDRRA